MEPIPADYMAKSYVEAANAKKLFIQASLSAAAGIAIAWWFAASPGFSMKKHGEGIFMGFGITGIMTVSFLKAAVDAKMQQAIWRERARSWTEWKERKDLGVWG